jgi:hypothetical protein
LSSSWFFKYCCFNKTTTSRLLEQRFEAISPVPVHYGNLKIVKLQIVASAWHEFRPNLAVVPIKSLVFGVKDF